MIQAGLRLGWKPGMLTAVVLLAATLVGSWLLSPVWWSRLGTDSRAFYSAASLAAGGGNPYDFGLLRAEEARVNLAAPPEQRAFSANPYGYPPLVTSLYEALLPLGERGFYWANVALLVAALGLGYALTVAATGWAHARLGAWALLVSAASVLGLVAANPSNLVFLAWAGGFYLLSRGRPVAAGAVLALTLVKAPIGLALTAALVLATPASAGLLLLGFGAGAALFLAANLLVAGSAGAAAWFDVLVGYAGGLGTPGAAYEQCCLAGLPALLIGHLSTTFATLVSGLLVAVILAFALRLPAARDALRRSWLHRVAVLTAAALLVSPYLHLNDLVLEALPLMVVAAARPSLGTVPALLTWSLGAGLPLAFNIIVAAVTRHDPASPAGFGIVITSLVLVGVATAFQPPKQPPRDGRPWGPASSV